MNLKKLNNNKGDIAIFVRKYCFHCEDGILNIYLTVACKFVLCDVTKHILGTSVGRVGSVLFYVFCL